MTSNQQRPLGRMTSELPPEAGKGSGDQKHQERDREEHFRKKEQPVRTPLRTEKAGTMGSAEKQQGQLQCEDQGKHEAGEGFLKRNWDLIPKGAKHVNHMTPITFSFLYSP